MYQIVHLYVYLHTITAAVVLPAQGSLAPPPPSVRFTPAQESGLVGSELRRQLGVLGVLTLSASESSAHSFPLPATAATAAITGCGAAGGGENGKDGVGVRGWWKAVGACVGAAAELPALSAAQAYV